MDSETRAELRLIIANVWLDIEEGFSEIPREFCWWNTSQSLSKSAKGQQNSRGFRLPVPTERRKPWLRAMNILKYFKVFSFRLVSENGQPMHYLSLDELPSELYYSIVGFSIHYFLSFCDRFDFDLTQPILKTHKGYLKIDAENAPTVTVDGVDYYFPPLHESTLVKMLKIALLPSLRDRPLHKSDLNREGSKTDVVNGILGKRRFYLGEKANRFRRYRTDLTDFPEILDIFYLLNETTIIGRGEIYITDEQLDKIQQSSESHEPHRK